MRLSSFYVKANARPATVSTVPIRTRGSRRLDTCSRWIQQRRRESILLRKDTPLNGFMVMGKFRSGLLALMVVGSGALQSNRVDVAPVAIIANGLRTKGSRDR